MDLVRYYLYLIRSCGMNTGQIFMCTLVIWANADEPNAINVKEPDRKMGENYQEVHVLALADWQIQEPYNLILHGIATNWIELYRDMNWFTGNQQLHSHESMGCLKWPIQQFDYIWEAFANWNLSKQTNYSK